MKSVIKLFNGKQAWIRIFEAFLAVLIIFAAMLLIVSKQEASLDSNDEIIQLQKNILDSISQDDDIRTDVLLEKREDIQSKVGMMVPDGINYSVSICNSTLVCPIDSSYVGAEILSNKEVYSSEVLILSNSTSLGDKKLKLFFWRNF